MGGLENQIARDRTAQNDDQSFDSKWLDWQAFTQYSFENCTGIRQAKTVGSLARPFVRMEQTDGSRCLSTPQNNLARRSFSSFLVSSNAPLHSKASKQKFPKPSPPVRLQLKHAMCKQP